MRRITLDAVDQSIKTYGKEANHIIRLSTTPKRRRKKSRTRSRGEKDALNQIAIARWNKAVEQGKIKSLGERVLYYDYH